MMALMWSIGGTTTYAGRKLFDHFLRAKMKEVRSTVTIPGNGLVYDFVFDFESSEWKKWLATISEFVVNPNTDFSQASLQILARAICPPTPPRGHTHLPPQQSASSTSNHKQSNTSQPLPSPLCPTTPPI